jgi:hypothetical protein
MWFVKQYAGALVGTMFGAVVATLTTMALYGDLPPIGDSEVIVQCLKNGSVTRY